LSWSHIWKVSFWDLNVENLVHLTWNDPFAIHLPGRLMRMYGVVLFLSVFVIVKWSGLRRMSEFIELYKRKEII
jgi:hypothetical protein